MKLKKQIYLWIIYLCGLFLSCQQSSVESNRIFPENILHEGDLAFREGEGLVSKVILTVDKGNKYSHIGIVIRHNKMWKVIHAVPGEPDFEGDKDRVKMEDIQTFFTKGRAISGAIMRINNDFNARAAAYKAFDLYKRNILFDHDYNLEDTTKMYCTELIYHIFKKAGTDLTQDRRSIVNSFGSNTIYILPSDIQKSSELKMIYSF